jgi:hypothetical protein
VRSILCGMTDGQTFTTAQRASYRPPPCPHCGRTPIFQWVKEEGITDVEPTWVPVKHRCPDPGCKGHEPSITGLY